MKASWLDIKVIHNERVTFLAEKLLGIFSGQYEFAWDGPQQFNDQSNVVYHHTQSVSSREGGGEVEGRTKQWTTWSDSVNTVIHPSWEKGDEREGKETKPCPDGTDSGHTHWRTSRLKIVRRIELVCFVTSAASGRASSEVMPHFCGFEATTVRLLCWGYTSKKSLLEDYRTCAEEDF